jgi:hypothetical protein
MYKFTIEFVGPHVSSTKLMADFFLKKKKEKKERKMCKRMTLNTFDIDIRFRNTCNNKLE